MLNGLQVHSISLFFSSSGRLYIYFLRDAEVDNLTFYDRIWCLRELFLFYEDLIVFLLLIFNSIHQFDCKSCLLLQSDTFVFAHCCSLKFKPIYFVHSSSTSQSYFLVYFIFYYFNNFVGNLLLFVFIWQFTVHDMHLC